MIPIQQLRQANTNNIGLCLRNDVAGFSIQEKPNDNLETITKNIQETLNIKALLYAENCRIKQSIRKYKV